MTQQRSTTGKSAEMSRECARVRSIRGLVVAGAVGFAATGCGVNQGYLQHSAMQVQVHDANFAIVRPAISASVDTNMLLCVIPTETGLFNQAMTALHAKADLQSGEALVNIAFDDDLRSYVLVCTRHLTVTADVVALGPPREPTVNRKYMTSGKIPAQLSRDLMTDLKGAVGETVVLQQLNGRRHMGTLQRLSAASAVVAVGGIERAIPWPEIDWIGLAAH
jgi:hypothetical protein